MFLNKNLIDYEISKEDEVSLKIKAAQICSNQALTPMQKKVIQLYSFITLIGACIIFSLIGFLVWKFGRHGHRIAQFASISSFGLLIGFITYRKVYMILSYKAISNIDETEIIKQWFKYLGITGVEVSQSLDPEFKEFILKARKDSIDKFSNVINFKHNNIETFIVFTKKTVPPTTLTGYIFQFIFNLKNETNDLWIFQKGFNKKWDEFEFKLSNHIKSSKNKLENQAFEKKFGIQTTDEIKKRMLLTPATQELINKKWKLKAVTISKNRSFMVTHSQLIFIDREFDPWKFRSQSIKKSDLKNYFNKSERLSGFNKKYAQFIFWKLNIATYLLGHSYLLSAIQNDQGTKPNVNNLSRRHEFSPKKVDTNKAIGFIDTTLGILEAITFFG